jgi:hypothetical protein
MNFKADLIFTPEHRAEAEILALDRRFSIDQFLGWAIKRRYKISRTALHEWRRDRRRLAADPVLQLRRYIADRIKTMSAEELAEVCKVVNALAA